MKNTEINLRKQRIRLDTHRKCSGLDPWFWSSFFEEEREKTFYFFKELNYTKIIKKFLILFKMYNGGSVENVEFFTTGVRGLYHEGVLVVDSRDSYVTFRISMLT